MFPKVTAQTRLALHYWRSRQAIHFQPSEFPSPVIDARCCCRRQLGDNRMQVFCWGRIYLSFQFTPSCFFPYFLEQNRNYYWPWTKPNEDAIVQKGSKRREQLSSITLFLRGGGVWGGRTGGQIILRRPLNCLKGVYSGGDAVPLDTLSVYLKETTDLGTQIRERPYFMFSEALMKEPLLTMCR